MSSLVIGGMLFAGMLALMAARVPIAVAMFVPGAIGYLALAGNNAFLSHLKGAVFARFSVYDLSVIPLFLLMGQFATQGGLSRSLFAFASSLVGHFRGGIAMAAMLACAAFGAISGSSVATAATVAQVALPEMRRFNYSGRLATATLAAGGTLGILIPPSVVLVIYAILTEQNIAKLFAAAFLPGFIATAGYLLAIAVYVRPDILLIDEVLAVGDAAFQAKCLAHIEKLRAENVTILIVSHSANVMRNLCSRVIWIKNGKLILDGDAKSVTAAYLTDVTGAAPSGA